MGYICSFFLPFLNEKRPFLVLWEGILASTGKLEDYVLLIQLIFPYILLTLFFIHLLLARLRIPNHFIYSVHGGYLSLSFMILLVFYTNESTLVTWYGITIQGALYLISLGIYIRILLKKSYEEYEYYGMMIVPFLIFGAMHLHGLHFSNYTFFVLYFLMLLLALYQSSLLGLFRLTYHIERSLIIVSLLVGSVFVLNNFFTSFMYSISLGNNEQLGVRIILSIYLIISAVVPFLSWRKIRNFALSHGIYLWFRFMTTFLIGCWFLFVLALSSGDTLSKLFQEYHSVNYILQVVYQRYLGNVILFASAVFLAIGFYIEMLLYRRRYLVTGK